MVDPQRELAWLRRARELSHQLVEEPEAGRLLPLILDSAIALAGAERGFLVRVQPGRGSLQVEVARGFDGVSLQGASGAVSRKVVEEVLQRGAGVVTTREEDRSLLLGTTIQERKVLAILCVPMRLRGQALGVIYLDHRFRPDAFHPGDVEPLRLFADQAALAIESMELQARRERAEAQLEQARDQLRAQESLEQRRHRLLEAHRARRDGPAGLGELVGASPAARSWFLSIERAARSRDPVLIVGETGGGKTAAAAELHRLSGVEGALVSVHCARLGPHELEAELVRAAGGTLLLEELVDATPALQAALVVVLQRQRQAPAVPGEPSPGGPARLVATSRLAPEELVRAGALREDLSYRLDVLRVDVPPLRARAEDVPLLLERFARAGGRPLELTPSALQLLVDYPWPGNLHELENVVRRLLPLDKKVTSNDLPPAIRERAAGPPLAGDEAHTMAAMEQRMVVDALQACGGNKAEAARRLGIQRSTLYRLMDRFGLR